MERTALDGISISEIVDNEDLVEKFLHYHRFFLSPRIYPLGTFYAYMISKKVFRPEDQDDAESPSVRLNKVGRFLDIVATKGPRGFRAFLEVLEYEYPHVYWHVANEKPRDPPRGWWPETPLSASSVRLKQKMADLISDLTNHSEEKKEKNEKLQHYVLEVEEDHRRLKKDLEELTSQKADLVETNKKYKAELDELRQTSCNNRDTIEKMRKEISELTACGAANSKERSISLDMSTMLTAKELHKENARIETQLATLRETEKQLIAELNEKKENYNTLVHEYSKNEKEFEEMRKKLVSCKEESNYYQSKSGDLASEYNELLRSFQQLAVSYEEEPIYRAYNRAPLVPDEDDYTYPDKFRSICTSTDTPPPIPPRMSEASGPAGGKGVVIIHAPAQIQATLYEKLLELPYQSVPGSANKRLFTSIEMESSLYTEVELQDQTSKGNMLHYESKSGIMMLSTDRLKELIKHSSEYVLLQMPPYKEFVITLKNAGIKFIVVLVKVEEQLESQLMSSLKANLTRHNIVTVAVPKTQLANVDDLSNKVMSAVQRATNRPAR